MTPEELDERIRDCFRRAIAWGNLTASDEKEIKQLIHDCIEAVTPEKFDVPSELSTGSENSTPRLIRRNGHNQAIDTIKQNTKELLG